MNADGSAQRRLTFDPAHDVMPALSPDGTLVVFGSTHDLSERLNLFVVNVDGSNRRQLTRGAFNDNNATFSPDGASILFSSDRDGEREIFVMALDGSNIRCLTTETTRKPWLGTVLSLAPSGVWYGRQ